MEYKWIVYITVNVCNGKFYIGVHKTKTPEIFDSYIGGGITSDSYAKYLYNKHKQKGNRIPFVSAVVKYGYKNFKRTTLRIFDNEKDAYALEAELVTETLLRSKMCYNVTPGGKLTCRKETKVYQFSLDGNFIRSYSSVKLAADSLKIDPANIFSVISGRIKSCGGYYWNTIKKFNFREHKYRTVEIAQYDINNHLIKKYNSIVDAVKDGYGRTSIYNSLRTGNPSLGYIWKYIKDDNIV